MTTELRGFDAALLTHLHQTVDQTVGAPVPNRHKRTVRRTAGGLAATGAAVVAGALGINLLTATPAFSVSEKSNGDIVVEVNRLEGAPALEEALARHGITADVTYLPPGQVCREGRFTEAALPGLMLAVGSDTFSVTLPAGVDRRQTFVLSASVQEFPDRTRSDGIIESDRFSASVDAEMASGPVAPCEPVTDPHWPGAPE